MTYKIARWNVTDRCNFSCAYCRTPNKQHGDPKELTLEQIKEHLIPALQEGNVWEVNLLGGEPTVRHDLLEIIRLLRKNCIGVALVTNGSKLTPELCQELGALRLTRVHISLDSHLPEFNQQSRINKEQQDIFQTQLQAIEYFAQHPTTLLHINCVVSSLNYESVPAFLDFLAEHGVQQVSLLGEARVAERNYAHRRLSFDEYLELGKQVYQKMEEYPEMEIIPTFLPIRGKQYLNQHYGTQYALTGGAICQPGVQEILVHSNGSVFPCNAFVTEEPKLVRYFDIEKQELQVTENSILEICKSDMYQKVFQVSKTSWYRQSLQPCGKCEFLEQNCFPCVMPRLTQILQEKEWKPLVAQPFCQYIAKLEEEEFNPYRVNPELVWHQEADRLYLYHPEEVETLTLEGLTRFIWSLVVKGYTDQEMVSQVYTRYQDAFAGTADCAEKVSHQIQDWIEYGYLHTS